MADTVRHVLITGGAGQVGLELMRARWPDDVRLHAPTRDELDLTDADSITRLFQATPFAAVINPAAYTAVDKAEDDVAAAFAVNAIGPALLAEATQRAGIPLIHVSTDYVFDGSAPGAYDESDPVAPLGVYGASKLAGELAVRSGNPRSVVLRTAWVFSAHRANFLKTMLRVGAQNPTLRVVADQRGCPTSAADIAEALVTIALRMMNDPSAPNGTYHFVNSGEATWHEFAARIFAEQTAFTPPVVDAITTADYPTRARRPANSRLATARITRDFGVRPRPWEEAMRDVLAELKAETTR
ncbi:dTDP-4-dehydrorhamnose reductase [Brevundimonas pondensis]|uniref:dTDP-4-dehydrorhamnose reductase n=1 Tax=Brevundimonas pondensis TaxID=2774189 RepID=A0ABX7SKG1_9CAUL|nr:dTDP-4-dehydrorhamnose reductase [Brevundimonas pondensis]QTC87320.1 dTDP-4-dehydrorhamnose reductase [Brevundimonas pondensis]